MSTNEKPSLFYLHGSTKKQNLRYWAGNNHRRIHERPLTPLHNPPVLFGALLQLQCLWFLLFPDRRSNCYIEFPSVRSMYNRLSEYAVSRMNMKPNFSL